MLCFALLILKGTTCRHGVICLDVMVQLQVTYLKENVHQKQPEMIILVKVIGIHLTKFELHVSQPYMLQSLRKKITSKALVILSRENCWHYWQEKHIGKLKLHTCCTESVQKIECFLLKLLNAESKPFHNIYLS